MDEALESLMEIILLRDALVVVRNDQSPERFDVSPVLVTSVINGASVVE